MPLRQFQDCRDRIDRAHLHFENFGNLWSDFVKDEPYTTYVSVDPDGTGRIEIEPTYDPMPSVFSLELGEGLYQLRAALDASIRACAIIETGQEPPPKEEELEFPITFNRQAFDDSTWKIAPLSDYRRWMIETIQPYNIVKGLRPDYLVLSPHRSMALLNNWARIDRHRRLHLTGSWASNRNPMLHLPEGTSIAYMTVNPDGFLEHEYQIAEFHLDGWVSGMKLQANPNLAIDIALREDPPPAADNDTLDNRLKMMR